MRFLIILLLFICLVLAPVHAQPTVGSVETPTGASISTYSAAGTNQGTATSITSAFNVVTTVSAGTGVIIMGLVIPIPTPERHCLRLMLFLSLAA